MMRTELTHTWPPCVLQHSTMTAEHSGSLVCWVPGLLGLKVSGLHEVLRSSDPHLGGVAVRETAVCGSG